MELVMRFYVDGKVYDSKDIPMAVVYSFEERAQMQSMPVKAKEHPYIYVKCPNDIPIETIIDWLIKNVPEFKAQASVAAKPALTPGDARD
jgi:hypothetical protein